LTDEIYLFTVAFMCSYSKFVW